MCSARISVFKCVSAWLLYVFAVFVFFDYYQANGYEVLGSWLMRYRVNSRRELTTCELIECWPESQVLHALNYIGSLDARILCVQHHCKERGVFYCGNSATAGLLHQSLGKGWTRK